MSKEPLKKRSLTTAHVIKTLREDGHEISEKDAGEILEFLYFLAKLSVNHYFGGNSDDLPKSE